MGRGDEQQGALAGIISDAPSVSRRISKKIQIWYERQIMAVEIYRRFVAVETQKI